MVRFTFSCFDVGDGQYHHAPLIARFLAILFLAHPLQSPS
ncbi:hypothetical protein A464_415 [Salmonella bongori N268-08]|uniref:Uncharacterized protein n=1 Tax=Salmonella bongori N268-08 TaxID=1197719 RepID=S5MM13_SALBN|nr:hypothetical protein A464_415 [Salmonella bongori N268-08]